MIPPILKEVRRDLREYLNVGSDTLWSGKDLVIVVGQNGAGKSMLRRMIKVGAQRRKIHTMDFSQEGRTKSGEELGFIKSLLYGNEEWESTGYISLRIFQKAFKQCPGRSYLIIWDEPEIGLSEESQLGVVQLIKEQLTEQRDELLIGCVFMTHSRLFVQQFLDYPKLAFVDMDGKFDTAEQWVNRKVKPANLQKVCDRGSRRFQKIAKMLKKKDK